MPEIRKPALGRPADSRLTAEFIASDPRFSGVSPFDPSQDVDIVDEMNAALSAMRSSVLSDGLTVTGDGVTSPLSTPGYDAWMGRFWRRGRGQEAEIDTTQRPDRFVKVPALDFANYTVGGIADGFNARFEGIITPKYSEQYTLIYYVDDGLRVWLDDVLVVDSWTTQGVNMQNRHTVNLGALTIDRPYHMRVEWFQMAGDVNTYSNPNRLYIGWQSASQAEQPIAPVGVVSKTDEQVFCHIYATSQQNPNTSYLSKISLTGVAKDTSSIFDSNSNRIVIKKSGVYDISASIVMTGLSNTYMNASVMVNGSERIKIGETTALGPAQAISAAGSSWLDTGDVVEIWLRAGGGVILGNTDSSAPGMTRLTLHN